MLDFADAARQVMDITWTKDRCELTEALPPVYTKHIGRQVLDHIQLLESVA